MKVVYRFKTEVKRNMRVTLPDASYAEVSFDKDLAITGINPKMRQLIDQESNTLETLLDILPLLTQRLTELGPSVKLVMVLSNKCPVHFINNHLTGIDPTVVVDPTGTITGGTILLRGLN